MTGSLAVGDSVEFAGNVTPALANQVVKITAISGGVYTVFPALSEAPNSGDTFSGGGDTFHRIIPVGDWVQFAGNVTAAIASQQVQITGIDPSGTVYTVSPALTAAPGNGDTFAQGIDPQKEQGLYWFDKAVLAASGTVLGGATTTTVPAAVTSGLAVGLAVGDWVQFAGNVTPAIANQEVQITGIDPSGTVYTVSPALAAVPGSGDTFVKVKATYTVQVVLPSGETPTYPSGGADTITLENSTPSLFGLPGQAETANFGISTDFVNHPTTTATIEGYLWDDLNQNGAWDQGEPGMAGWTIYLDLKNSGQFDQGDPSVVTGADGSYIFANLAPGTYRVADFPSQFAIQSYPDNLGDAVNPHSFVVTVTAGEVVAGLFGTAQPPNFGAFNYSPFVRPADNPLTDWQTVAPSISLANYTAALQPWQSFTVTNNTASSLQVTAIDPVLANSQFSQFLVITDDQLNVVWDDNSNLIAGSNTPPPTPNSMTPISVAPGGR